MSLLSFGFKRKASEATDKADAPLVSKSIETLPVPSKPNVAAASPAIKKQKSEDKNTAEEENVEEVEEKKVVISNPVAVMNSSAAEQFTATLTDETWKEKLSSTTSSKTFSNLVTFVNKERASKTIFPPEEEVFSAFNLTPFDKVKVIIIGQDPYHGPGQGHGLSFSVKPNVQIPPSLRNIYKMQLETNCLAKKPTTGYLKSWAEQGVFCLNVTLTVRQGDPNSHETKKRDGNVGWKYFTSNVLKKLSREKENLVFFGWGKNAENIIAETVDKRKHLIINSSHPSPLGATKTARPFMGSDCFNKCNQYLEEKGETKIDWDTVNK